jgi:hypothetical protein
LKILHEEIKISGRSETVKYAIYLTHRGPLISNDDRVAG